MDFLLCENRVLRWYSRSCCDAGKGAGEKQTSKNLIGHVTPQPAT